VKKIRSKIRSLRKNRGSGLVLVMIAVAFIGILVGSLLTAAGYAYRLKLYDYNAKDNFYYLENAMEQIYAGVGNDSLTCMQDSYNTVINEMVAYDMSTKSYVAKDYARIKQEFLDRFLENVGKFLPYVADTSDQHTALDNYLRSFISDSDVKIVDGMASVIRYDADGNQTANNEKLSKIVIKNVVLERTARYNRSTAKGNFTQTISTDIIIEQPDFDMDFKSIDVEYSSLFDYCMVADNGIEITQNTGSININGNIYAGADFYNKDYNQYNGSVNQNILTSGFNANGSSYENSAMKAGGTIAASAELDGSIISSKEVPSVVYDEDGYAKGYNFYNGPVNKLANVNTNGAQLFNARIWNESQLQEKYDGVNETSRYSGLYIKGAKVNIQADELIVPGTIAILDNAEFSLYGRTGGHVGETDVWTDNIVLDSTGSAPKNARNAGVSPSYLAPSLLARANFHVRDDLEMNADYASFILNGRYYGFGNSTKADSRSFVPTVTGNFAGITAAKYFIKDRNGLYSTARGHYNSSAIVINGQNTNLDLSEADALFLAGRAYVELSKDVTLPNQGEYQANAEYSTATQTIVDPNDNTVVNSNVLGENPRVVTKTYTYDGNSDDFRTGESLSIKTNQLAYVPLNITGVDTTNATPVYVNNDQAQGIDYYLVKLPGIVQDTPIFQDVVHNLSYFGDGNVDVTTVPCQKYLRADGTSEYYYDFEHIYQLYYNSVNDHIMNFNYLYKEINSTAAQREIQVNEPVYSADDIAKQFIIAYYALISNDSPQYADAKACFADISADFDSFKFDEGSIDVPNRESSVYSSGAITAKDGTTFTISTSNNLVNSMTTTDAMSGENPEYATDVINALLSGSASQNTTTINAYKMAEDMEERYAYVKWALKNYNSNDSQDEYDYVKTTLRRVFNTSSVAGTPETVRFDDEGYLTPLNRYLNYNQIDSTTNISPETGFKLNSNYRIWISGNDVTVKANNTSGIVQGIVVTRGNVFFDPSVTRFEGIIIAGDKIFINNGGLTSIGASPEVVRATLNECMTLINNATMGAAAKKCLLCFKSYEKQAYNPSADNTFDTKFKTIDTIQYSDVVQYANWMKNVSDNVVAPEESEGGTNGDNGEGGETSGAIEAPVDGKEDV